MISQPIKVASYGRGSIGKITNGIHAIVLSKTRSFASNKAGNRRKLPDDGVTLSHFTQQQQEKKITSDLDFGPLPVSAPLGLETDGYQYPNQVLKFHLKTYGCQMNVSDSDIIRSILLDEENNIAGHQISFKETQEEMDADVLLTNTCAIRENAESKVWNRLKQLRSHDSKNPLEKLSLINSDSNTNTALGDGSENPGQSYSKRKKKPKKRKRIIGVLGCMAERLKEDMFKDGTADLIVGPDAYRDLPRLISALAPTPLSSSGARIFEMPMMERALNVELSFDGTYEN